MSSNALIDFISGILGATTSVYVGQPLDTIKTKLQTFPSRYKDFLDCTKKIFRQEGLRGYYAGSIPALLSTAAENGVLFMAYGQCQQLICVLKNEKNYEQLSTGENMIAGSLASVFSSLALCPTELVKCRMQTFPDLYQRSTISSMEMTRNILRTEGIRGLFRGFTSTLMRECPGYACFFGGYELTRSILTKKNERKSNLGFLQTWICGGLAGICFWIVVYPIDAVKTRTQVFQINENFLRYTMNIIQKEGLLTLYAGLFPTLLRTFVATGTLFITYEQGRILLERYFYC